jgi:3-dehydroquinate synthase II
MSQKKVIFEFKGDWDDIKPLFIEAITAGFSTFVLRDPEIVEKVRSLGKVEVVSPDAEIQPDLLLVEAGPSDPSDPVLQALLAMPIAKCITMDIGSKEDEDRARQFAAAGASLLIAKATDWRVIPLENLIADFQKLNTTLAASVTSIDEARLFFETLQVGVKEVFFSADAPAISPDDRDFAKWKKLVSTSGHVDMVDIEITKIEEIGSGDRVCVDTISMIDQGEGLLIGNHAKGFFLVHGEIADTEFVNARPFRVNAGAVHSYTLRAGNKTAYLSELKAGEPVMLVDFQGNTRDTRVGRVKIETRPMLLVEGQVEDETISAILQNAETICLVDESGHQVSVSRLSIGDHVKGYMSGSKGRHFGRDIEEKIIEK